MRLRDVAVVRLGFKSLLNDFFYVDDDRRTHFDIEPEFLEPIYMLADLDSGSYAQHPEPTRYLFTCKATPADLRGTGAWKYIEWGAQQRTVDRKQSKISVLWSEAPALKNFGHWYFPAAPIHLTRIAIRKGVGRTYAPFVFDHPVLLDQRLYILEGSSIDDELLAAYLSSSLFALSFETDADLGLGAGVLTIGAGNLRGLPVPEFGAWSNGGAADRIRNAFADLLLVTPPQFDKLAAVPEQVALDSAWLAALGLPESRVSQLTDEVALLADARINAAAKRKATLRASSNADVAAVSGQVARSLGRWLQARRFPEDYIEGSWGTRSFAFPVGTLRLSSSTLLNQCELVVQDDGGTELFAETVSTSVAELLVRCLQLGRRSFTIPDTDTHCNAVLDDLDGLLDELDAEMGSLLANTPTGVRHEEAIKASVLRMIGVPLKALRGPFEAVTLAIPAPVS